jgi:RNA polymerase sigma-70 factor (ECF subfamily)
MTDADLVARTLAGERESFDELVDRHFADCLRFARHMLGTAHDAEDVVQESFVRAYRALARYDERQTFRAWLFRILINRCRSSAAARGRRDERIVLDERAVQDAASNRSTTQMDDALSLAAALATLDPRSRETFLLHYGEGLDYAEISRLCGDGISALKMRVKRARERLRAFIEEPPDVR